jgi:peptidoglycan hydrolase CwlO-like protein
LEQQTQEYQEKLEQADLAIQHLQSELQKLQEEKIKSNDTMNSLIQELERMKTELQHRG